MPERALQWLAMRRLGVKQLALAALGILALIPSGLRTLNEVFPLEAWGWVWVTIGAASFIMSFTEHYRLPFIPLLIITLLWSASYSAEWVMDIFVRDIGSRDYITAVSYAVQALLILAVIRLIDPAEVRAPGGDRDVD